MHVNLPDQSTVPTAHDTHAKQRRPCETRVDQSYWQLNRRNSASLIQIQGTKDQLGASPTSLTPVKHPSAVVPPVLSARSRPSVCPARSFAFPNGCTSTASGKRTSSRVRMPATGCVGGMCTRVGSEGEKIVMRKKALRPSISTVMPIEHPGRAALFDPRRRKKSPPLFF